MRQLAGLRLAIRETREMQAPLLLDMLVRIAGAYRTATTELCSAE